MELLAQGLPGFDSRLSTIPFRFRIDNTGSDTVAAQVVVIEDLGNSNLIETVKPINQLKRTTPVNSTLTGPGLTIDQLRSYVKAGNARETLVHENLTVNSHSL